jgi:hypothetical protein
MFEIDAVKEENKVLDFIGVEMIVIIEYVQRRGTTLSKRHG